MDRRKEGEEMMMGMGKKEAGTEDFMFGILVIYFAMIFMQGTAKGRFQHYIINAISLCLVFVHTVNTAPRSRLPRERNCPSHNLGTTFQWCPLDCCKPEKYHDQYCTESSSLEALSGIGGGRAGNETILDADMCDRAMRWMRPRARRAAT